MATTLPKTVLLFSAILALYTLWIIPYQNGLLTSLIDVQRPGAYLPGSILLTVRHNYTGIKVLDKQIVTLIGFFWPALDGSRADVSLAFLETETQLAASWVLVVIESLRVGNKGKWYITSTTIAGILLKNLGFGLIMPLWLCLHLAYSATVNSSSAAPLAASNPLPFFTLPLSTMLAFLVPNILMILPTPHTLSPTNSTKQLYTALSQFSPVFLTAFQIILPMTISAVTPGINALTERDKKVKSLKYLRRNYAFAFALATAFHLIAVGVPLLSHLFPALFSPAYLPQLHPSNVFVPRSPLKPIQPIATVADGVLGFAQWDLLTGSLSVLLWALTLRVKAQARGFWAYELVEGLVKIAALVAVSGPVGAAVAVVWERDELVFEKDFQDEKARKSF